MKHVFVDTNLLIDFLADRKPFSESATKLFEMEASSLVKLYVASVSFNNIYYIVRQQHSHLKTIELLQKLSQYVEILSVDDIVIKKAISSGFNDFEDAIQNFCAESEPEVEVIATRNEKDFKNSSLAVLNPEAALRLLAS